MQRARHSQEAHLLGGGHHVWGAANYHVINIDDKSWLNGIYNEGTTDNYNGVTAFQMDIYWFIIMIKHCCQLWWRHQDDVFDDYNHTSDMKKNGSSGGYPILTGGEFKHFKKKVFDFEQ